MTDWESLRYLLAVSRAGSLSAAARALDVDKATVSRRIASLEAAVGARVLVREGGVGAMRPTEVGRALLGAAAQTEAALQEATRNARADASGPRGVVRLTTVDVLAQYVVAPVIPVLRRRYPELVLDLLVTPQVLDLGREADLALRLTRPTEGALVARKAGAVTLRAYVSRERLRGGDASALAAPFDVIAFGEHFIRHGENGWIDQLASSRVVLHTTSVGAAAMACEGGVGVALLPTSVAARFPSLVALPQVPQRTRDLWLVMHPDFARSPRVRAVADAVVEAFTARDERVP